jgi:hypothetical protein
MKKKMYLKRLGIAILIIGLALSGTMFFYKFPTTTQVTYQTQVPYQDTVNQTQTLDHRENYQIQAGQFAYSNFTADSGKTLVVTWQIDNPVAVYLITSSEFSTVKLLGFPISSLASEPLTYGGSLSYQILSNGTYYVVIRPALFNVYVTSYKAELQWQEQVTKYRNETDLRTETTYVSSSFGINLGIGISVLGSILTALGFVNLKPIIEKNKKLKNLTCNSIQFKVGMLKNATGCFRIFRLYIREGRSRKSRSRGSNIVQLKKAGHLVGGVEGLNIFDANTTLS